MGRPIRTYAPTLIEDCSSGANWTVSGGVENAASTITLPDGTSASRVSFTQTSGTNMFITCTRSLNVVGKRGIELDIWIDGNTNGATQSYQADIRIRTAGPADTYASDLYLHRGWNKVRVGKGAFSATGGSPNWASSTFVDILIKIVGIASQSMTVFVSDLSYSGYSRPQCPIVFDDGYPEVINTAYPIMAALGIKGTVAVISSKVGTAGYMTETELQTLHDAGWALVNHDDLHSAAPFLATSTVGEIVPRIANCQNYLKGKGWTRDNEHLIYVTPYGENTTAYLSAASLTGCTAFFGLGLGNNTTPASSPSADFICASPSLQVIPRVNCTRAWSAAQIIAYATQCIVSGKGVTFCFHKIGTETTDLDVSTAKFTSFIQYLYRNRALIDCPTLPEFVARCQSPTT